MRESKVRPCFRAGTIVQRAHILMLSLVIVVPFLGAITSRVHAAQSGLTGHLDVVDCTRIAGWAWDPNDPNTPIDVDILDGDTLIVTVTADEFRQDLLNAGIGNGFHGFDIPTPTVFRNSETHTVRARPSLGSSDLNGSPSTINCASIYQGNFDVADCTRIAGWAWDMNQPNTPINVSIYIDNDNFASIQAPANQFRQDLLDAGKGNGVHGFSFMPPAFLKDGVPHQLHVKFTGTTLEIPGSPRTINCGTSPQPIFQGNHEVTDCNKIAGWAWDANQPNTSISVDIYDKNVLIATIPADQFRQDLLDSGKGNGVHAFNFPTPNSLKDGNPHTISIGFSGTATGLSGTGQTITCTGSGPINEGNLDQANCTIISGWAWDANQPNTPIDVEILDGAAVIATVTANQFRQDLLDAGMGNGNHGFSLATPVALQNGQPHSIRARFAGTSTFVPTPAKTFTCN